MRKSKGGRPKLPRGEALTSVIAIRLTKKEREWAEMAAKQAKVKLSVWLRDVIKSSADCFLLDM